MPNLSNKLVIIAQLLKNILCRKIEIEYIRVMKYILVGKYNINYKLSKNLIKDIVLTMFNIMKNQKLRTKNISIIE